MLWSYLTITITGNALLVKAIYVINLFMVLLPPLVAVIIIVIYYFIIWRLLNVRFTHARPMVPWGPRS
jgi:hypothetical protein